MQARDKHVKISISLPGKLLSTFDEASVEGGYTRSEAVREGMRLLILKVRGNKEDQS